MIQQSLAIIAVRRLFGLAGGKPILLQGILQYGLQIRIDNLHVVARPALPHLVECPSPSSAQAVRQNFLDLAKGFGELARRALGRRRDMRGGSIVVRIWEVVLEAVDAVAEEELRCAVEGETGDKVLEIEGVVVPEVRFHLLNG